MASTASDAAQSPKVGIVVLNYHGTSDTLKCLDSLKALDPENCLTIVVDNGSTPDPSSQFTQAHPWATVIRREENGGWAGGNNTGIRHALEHGAEWVLLLNNDTIVAPQICRPPAGCGPASSRATASSDRSSVPWTIRKP